MLETTSACEIGPVAGPIGFTNGIFIVVGGTSVANHHVDSPRIIGMPRPEQGGGRRRVGGDHGRTGGDLAAVGEDADALAGAAGHPEHVDAVLDGMVETQRELVGQRLHAQRRHGRACPSAAPASRAWRTGRRCSGPRRRTPAGRTGAAPPHGSGPRWRGGRGTPPTSCRHRPASAPEACATARSTGAAGRCPGAGRARSGWSRSGRPATRAGSGSRRGGPAPCRARPVAG